MSSHTIRLDVPAAWWMTSNQRMHHMERARRTGYVRHAAKLAARGLAPLASPVTISAAIGLPTARRFDPPNSSPTVKAAIDGVVDAGVLADDSSKHVTAVTFCRDHCRTERGRYRLTLTITEEAS